MSLMTITIGLWVIFLLSMLYEPRNFWNALLLFFNGGMTMLVMAMKPGVEGKILGIFIMLIPIFFFMAALFLIINGIQMIRKEGHHLQNLLSLFTGIIMIFGSIATLMGMYYFQEPSMLRSVFFLILTIELYVSVTFVSLLLYSLLYTYIPKRVRCDYIIVHGCGLTEGERVSPLLKGRVDKAVKIFKKGKGKAKIVVSGGKGSDEKVSEAQAMKNYLLGIGFPEDKIILEDQSKTTYENLRNVNNMFPKNGRKPKYLFVTNNYHVFRTSLLAKKLKMNAAGVGCKTAGYYWPSAFIREYIAIMMKYKWVFVMIVAVWLLIEAGVYLG